MAILQAQVVFHDNAFKLLTIGLIGIVMSAEEFTLYKVLVGILTILPFVLLAPVAGWVSDRFRKSRVIQAVMMAQLAVTAIMIAGIQSRQIMVCVAAFGMLSALCALISPAKIGIIKEYVGEKKLGFYAGWVEMLTVMAILVGAYAGGTGFDWFVRRSGMDPWRGALEGAWALGALAVIACLMSFLLASSDRHEAEPFRKQLIFSHFSQIDSLWGNVPVRVCCLGISYFYAVGGVVFLVLVDVGLLLHPDGVGTAGATGYMMALMGAGIILGSFLAGLLSRSGVETGLIPWGAALMALSYGLLYALPVEAWIFYVVLFMGGMGGGLYVVPLNAWLQNMAEPSRRGGIFAGMNLVTNLFSIAALAFYFVLIRHFKLTPEDQFFVLMMVAIGVTVIAFRLLWPSVLRLGRRFSLIVHDQ